MADSRHAILLSAFAQIRLNGFQATSVLDILKKTGLTKGAFYHYFPTKNSLGLAVIEELVKPEYETFFISLSDARDRIGFFSVLRKRIADLEVDTLGCAFNNLLNEMPLLDPFFRQKLLGIFENFRKAVETAVSRFPEMSGDDPAAISSLVVSTFQGAAGLSKLAGSKRPLYEAVERLEKDFARFITPQLPLSFGKKEAPEKTVARPAKNVSMDWD